jgi:hypothetical protein
LINHDANLFWIRGNQVSSLRGEVSLNKIGRSVVMDSPMPHGSMFSNSFAGWSKSLLMNAALALVWRAQGVDGCGGFVSEPCFRNPADTFKEKRNRLAAQFGGISTVV